MLREEIRIKAEKEEAMKEKFLDAWREEKERGNYSTYSFSMLQALRDMARNDVWPDYRFGDMDCNVWSMFRR